MTAWLRGDIAVRGGLARLTSNDDVRSDGLVGKGARSVVGREGPFDGLSRDLSIAPPWATAAAAARSRT